MSQNLNLNDEYLDRMKEMLGSTYPAFFESMQMMRTFGLRFNALKVSEETKHRLVNELPFGLRQIEWEENGYYYDGNSEPGKSVYHDIGAYYIQEPSAQSVVADMEIKPGDIVLDLCASPGGKSTQILSKLQGKGLLVSNEIVHERSLTLASNIERIGAANSIVLNENPDNLSSRLQSVFDHVLIDSPCSGEGMFRKNPEAIKEWSAENVEICANRDDDILDAAAIMVRPGGYLSYSTCTFEYVENEGAIERFLSRHEDYILLNEKRLYPHEIEGEGHFAAYLKRRGNDEVTTISNKNLRSKNKSPKIPAEFAEFSDKYLVEGFLTNGRFYEYKDQLFWVREEAPVLDGLHIIRPGLNLGIMKKGRFEPGHAFAMTLNPSWVKGSVELTEAELLKYLKGESISLTDSMSGWVLVCHEGISAGWGKVTGNILKNHYPKGLRRY